MEPGKALSEGAAVLLTRVLCIREATSLMKADKSMEAVPPGRAAVLDCCLSEISDLHSHNHPVAWLRPTGQHGSAEWCWLPLGVHHRDVLYGRTCRECDEIAGRVKMPAELAEGDWLAVGNVGAYDVSMAYSFGNGSLVPALEMLVAKENSH